MAKLTWAEFKTVLEQVEHAKYLDTLKSGGLDTETEKYIEEFYSRIEQREATMPFNKEMEASVNLVKEVIEKTLKRRAVITNTEVTERLKVLTDLKIANTKKFTVSTDLQDQLDLQILKILKEHPLK